MVQSCHIELSFLFVPLLLGYHGASLEIIAVADCRVGAKSVADGVQVGVRFNVVGYFRRCLGHEVGARGGS